VTERKKTIALTVIIFLLIFCAVIDLFLGMIFLKKDEIRIPDPYNHHGLKPLFHSNAEWGSLNYRLFTNSLGLKDSSTRKIEKVNRQKRLVFIGDSFTEGIGYNYEKTFAGIISDSLKESYEILNAGLTSYSPILYFLKIQHIIESGYKIDQIIVMIDISDIQDEIIYENYIPDKKSSLIRSVDIKLSNLSFSYNLVFRKFLKKIKKHGSGNEPDESVLEESIEKRGSWTYDENSYNEWGKRGLFLAKTNMTKLHKLCMDKGISMVIAVYPWPEQILKDTAGSKQVLFWSEFCLSNDIDFIDLFPYFFEDSDKSSLIGKYFIEGDCHWNENGHRLIAEKILDKLKKTE